MMMMAVMVRMMRVLGMVMIMMMMVMMVGKDFTKMSFITKKVLVNMIMKLMTPVGQETSSVSLVIEVLCY